MNSRIAATMAMPAFCGPRGAMGQIDPLDRRKNR
jgi:hypothetical protein